MTSAAGTTARGGAVSYVRVGRGEQCRRDPDLLRGPRDRPPGSPRARLPAGRPLVGEAGSGAAFRRVPRGDLRPTRPSAPPARPSVGYDYDTLAADLSGAARPGSTCARWRWPASAAGTGEVTRYLGTYGYRTRARRRRSWPRCRPSCYAAADNPDGVDRGVLDEFISRDLRRPARRDEGVPGQVLQHRPARWRSGSATRPGRTAFHVAIGASAAVSTGAAPPPWLAGLPR